jgi:hypothetical protein
VLSLEEASSIENPCSIPYGKIFHTIPTYNVDAKTGKDIRDGKNFIFEKIGEIPLSGLFFLYDEEADYLSLCKNQENTAEILRNNVGISLHEKFA